MGVGVVPSLQASRRVLVGARPLAEPSFAIVPVNGKNNTSRYKMDPLPKSGQSRAAGWDGAPGSILSLASASLT